MTFLYSQFGKLEYSEQEIDRCIGILKVNGMKLESGRLEKNPGVVLYPIYCLINSDCVSNTNYIKTSNLELQLRSQKPIRKGEEITTRYVSSTMGNNRRRQYLKKYWYFDCCCSRCGDSTELGTNMSSVICNRCRQGFLIKTRPLDYESPWRCDNNNCETEVDTETVDTEVDKLEAMSQGVDMGDVDQLEELLYRLGDGTILHPSHYIILEISHSLVFAYNSHKTLTRPQMDRKIQLCRHVLSVLSTVDNGFTAWRGKILNELSNTLLLVSRADYANNIINLVTYKKRIFESMKNVSLAKKCINMGFTDVNK